MIRRYTISGGRTHIEVSRVHIIKEQTAREISRWNAVLDSLENKGYIKAEGVKREIFKITNDGFKIADMIVDSDQLSARPNL